MSEDTRMPGVLLSGVLLLGLTGALWTLLGLWALNEGNGLARWFFSIAALIAVSVVFVARGFALARWAPMALLALFLAGTIRFGYFGSSSRAFDVIMNVPLLLGLVPTFLPASQRWFARIRELRRTSAIEERKLAEIGAAKRRN